MSESQERMMAVVEPADVDAFLAICEKWDVEAVVIGEVTDSGPAAHRLARRARRRRTPAVRRARRSDLPAAVRPPRLAGRPAGRRRRGAAAPVVRRRAARHPAAAGRLAQPLRQVVDHRPVRPLRAGQHRAGPAEPTPAWCASTRTPTSASRCRPTATAASPSSTPTPAPSSRSPRPTATSPPAAPRPLAVSDCLNFGSPEDPDVMWQFAEACRGLKDACLDARHPGDRRQRQPLQPDRRDGDPADAGRGGARRHRRRHPRTPTGFGAGGRAVLPARRDPRGALRLRVGARRARPPRRRCRRRSTSRPSTALAAAAGRTPRRDGLRDQRPRPLRRRAGPGAGGVLPAPRHRRHGLAGLGATTRSSRCSPSPPPARS